jgi:hypothetical protein
MYHKSSTGFGVRHLLPPKTLKSIKPYINVRVEEYTEDEMTAILDYYTHTRWLVSGKNTVISGTIPHLRVYSYTSRLRPKEA